MADGRMVKVRVATKAKLLESIEHLQLSLRDEQARTATANERCDNERNAKYVAQNEAKAAVDDMNRAKYSEDRLRGQCDSLRLQLTEKDARAEAFEFVLRLQHGAPVVDPPKAAAPERHFAVMR